LPEAHDERQKIHIEPDEWIAGTRTEKFLAGPIPVERGDFLRSLQVEIDTLHLKKRRFLFPNVTEGFFSKRYSHTGAAAHCATGKSRNGSVAAL